MKNLILVLLFLPLLSFSQKFEISEMGGYSKYLGKSLQSSGYSNQLSFNFYFTKRFSLGAVYELNLWQPSFYSVGITPAIHFRHFYFGATASIINIQKWHLEKSGTSHDIKYKSPYSAGVHAGLTQKLFKNLYLKEQIGFCYAPIETTFYNFQPSVKQDLNYFSMLIGVSYRL